MGLTVFHVVFPDIHHIQIEYGDYMGILRGILLVPHNIVTNLSNVVYSCSYYLESLNPKLQDLDGATMTM